jgi:hypothetical protein
MGAGRAGGGFCRAGHTGAPAGRRRRPVGDASNQSESPMRLVVAMLSLWIGVAIVGMLAKMQQTIKADAQTLMHVPPDRGEPTR